MSAKALLTAVQSKLRTLLSDPTGKIVGVQATGRPPANCGQWYYAVWWNRADQRDRNPLSHEVAHGFTVTITARMAYAPRDRVGVLLQASDELLARAEAIAAPGVLHCAYDVVDAANLLIEGTAAWSAAQVPPVAATVNGFLTPAVLLDYGPVVERTGEWVAAASEKPPTILTCDVRFGEMTRHQYPV